MQKLISFISCRWKDEDHSSQGTNDFLTPEKKADELLGDSKKATEFEFVEVSHLVIDALQAIEKYESENQMHKKQYLESN